MVAVKAGLFCMQKMKDSIFMGRDKPILFCIAANECHHLGYIING